MKTSLSLGPITLHQLKALNPKFYRHVIHPKPDDFEWEVRARRIKPGDKIIGFVKTDTKDKSFTPCIAILHDVDASGFDGSEGMAVLTDGQTKWSADYNLIAALS